MSFYNHLAAGVSSVVDRVRLPPRLICSFPVTVGERFTSVEVAAGTVISPDGPGDGVPRVGVMAQV